MPKASTQLDLKAPTLNRRRVLVGAAAVAAGGAAAAPVVSAPATFPLFKLTPAARELVALDEQEWAAHVALDAVPGPTDTDHHSDASPEWLAARDRWHAIRDDLDLRGKSKAVVAQVIGEPVTIDNVLTLAVAAQAYPPARAILMCAVLQLACVRDVPLDLFWQPDIS